MMDRLRHGAPETTIPALTTPCASQPTTKTQIFQIFYLESQTGDLEQEFIPYSNIANPRPEWCEYYVFHKEYHAGTCDKGITGFVSWKFHQKTGIPAGRFLNWIDANPGHDVYFINPFSRYMNKFRPNVWRQGERCHPGLTDMAQRLFAEVGYTVNLRRLNMNRQKIAFCNFWAATPDFWRKYMGFTEPLYELIEHGLSQKARALLLEKADSVSGCCYIPYIFERLFSTLLSIDPSIRAIRMPTREDQSWSWSRWAVRELRRPILRYVARRTSVGK